MNPNVSINNNSSDLSLSHFTVILNLKQLFYELWISSNLKTNYCEYNAHKPCSQGLYCLIKPIERSELSFFLWLIVFSFISRDFLSHFNEYIISFEYELWDFHWEHKSFWYHMIRVVELNAILLLCLNFHISLVEMQRK